MPVRPRKNAVPKKVDTLAAAQAAVEKFEEERAQLLAMKAEFEEQFLEAHSFLQDIKRQEDLVQDAIKKAIPLIREAKQDVGDFKCQLKRTTPGYDDTEFSKLVVEIEEGGAILIELIEGGFIKKLILDPSSAAYFAQHPDAAEHFAPAWREAEDMTPAITAPKF